MSAAARRAKAAEPEAPEEPAAPQTPTASAPLPRPAETLAVTRGTMRLLRDLGHAPLVEMPLPCGRRADILALAPNGELLLVEVKSCAEDFRADGKWRDYAAWCDRFAFAVPGHFPVELIPAEAGLILADAYGAMVLREAPRVPLAPARRKAVVQGFARLAAARLHAAMDPDLALARHAS